MNYTKVIKKIFVENIGWVDNKKQPIEEIWVAGEMANVRWFRKGLEEFNGKYVVKLEYELKD